MKVVKTILNVTVWAVLGLYVLFMLTANIPSVQRFTARRVSAMLASRLGTSVSIGTAVIDLPNHLTLRNVLILDQQSDTLLSAARLSAGISLTQLAEGNICIQSAQLFGTRLCLRQATEGAPLNMQFVIDSLSSNDTVSRPLPTIRVNSLIVRRSSVSYDRMDMPQTPDTINRHHILLRDISAHIILKELSSDSLNLNIRRLSFREQSGLSVGRLKAKMALSNRQASLHDASLQLVKTNIALGDIDAAYRMDGDSLDIASLRVTGSIAPSVIALGDFKSLVPQLDGTDEKLIVASTFSITGDTLAVPLLIIKSEDGCMALGAEGTVSGPLREPSWTVSVNDFSTSSEAFAVVSDVAGIHDNHLQEIVSRIGNLRIQGNASGHGHGDFIVRADLSCPAGRLSVEGSADSKRRLTAHVETDGIDLGTLTGIADLGKMAATIDGNGTIAGGRLATADMQVTLGTMEYRGYALHDVLLSVTHDGRQTSGRIQTDDPNAALNIEGTINSDGNKTAADVTANVMTLQPSVLNLTDRWGDANFIGDIEAHLTGSSLADITGTVSMTDFQMLSPKGSYELNRLTLRAEHDSTSSRRLTIDSDFANMSLSGRYDLTTLHRSVANVIGSRLPTLPGMPPKKPANNSCDIHLELQKSDWLQHLFNIPISITSPVVADASVSDAEERLSLKLTAPSIEYDGRRFANANASISTADGQLRYKVSADQLSDDGKQPLTLTATGSAYDNLLSVFLEFGSSESRGLSGQLNATASFDQTLDKQQTTYLSIAKSALNVNGVQWNVDPAYLVYSKNKLDVYHFSVHNERQFITVDGTASQLAQDSLNISLGNVDIDYLLDMVGFDAVSFSGLASGSGCLHSVFGNLQADGDLTVSDFLFQHGRMGTLYAHAAWNTELEQIDISATADDGPEAQTVISGYVTPQRDSINLLIEANGTYLDFAHSFTSSFISHIEGHADGSLRLIGPLDAINLEGLLVLNGSAHVKTLGCTYQLVSDTVRCIPDEVIFDSCSVYDARKHRGVLTGGIHHKHLTKLTYDIYADADNLLAYDFRDFGDDTFYGTVYASGRVGIHGRDEGVLIDGDITTQPGTTFVYNAANPETLANQEFILWGEQTAEPAGSRASGSEEKHDKKPQPLLRSDMNIQLQINCTPDATVRLLMDAHTNDYITLHGSGLLNTTYYNKGGLQIFGTYRVSGGTYDITIQDIIRKNFTFNDGGTVVFSGDPYDAALNLQAQYVVNGVSLSDLNVGNSFANTVRVNCLMNIEGQPRAPIVSFDLDMPNVNSDEKQMVRSLLNSQEEMNQQVVYLLAVGRFYPQGANNAATENGERSRTSLAMQSLLSGTLSGQINSILSNVVNSNEWNFGANISTGDEGWNNAEYEGLVSGRLLNNRLLINGQFGYRDNATTATPSFIGDFDIRYLLLPSGNLALKVYNQTNDRYFTRSSLNTQGIGVIMKKEFDTLGDFFGKKRKKRK